MTDLEGTILYWQTVLATNAHLLEPSVTRHIENTIAFLVQFKEIVSHVSVPK